MITVIGLNLKVISPCSNLLPDDHMRNIIFALSEKSGCNRKITAVLRVFFPCTETHLWELLLVYPRGSGVSGRTWMVCWYPYTPDHWWGHPWLSLPATLSVYALPLLGSSFGYDLGIRKLYLNYTGSMCSDKVTYTARHGKGVTSPLYNRIRVINLTFFSALAMCFNKQHCLLWIWAYGCKTPVQLVPGRLMVHPILNFIFVITLEFLDFWLKLGVNWITGPALLKLSTKIRLLAWFF